MASAMLNVVGLTKRFGGLIVSQDIHLEIAAGETHAVIGPNGAGKTTLINQIQGEGSGYFARFGAASRASWDCADLSGHLDFSRVLRHHQCRPGATGCGRSQLSLLSGCRERPKPDRARPRDHRKGRSRGSRKRAGA